MQSIQLTFILIGYFLSFQVLPDRPSQYVLGYDQCTHEQWKAMLCKQQKWVPYPSLKAIFCLMLLWTWDIRMDGHPSARENSNKTTPHNVPDGVTMCEVYAWIWLQWPFIDRRDRVGINIKLLNKVVNEDEKQHCEKVLATVTVTPFIRKRIAKFEFEYMREMEYGGFICWSHQIRGIGIYVI